MSLGTWNPEAGSTPAIDLQPQLLDRLASLSRDDRLADLATALTSREQEDMAALMKLDHALWQQAADGLPEEDILHLLRFFAVAENLPGWEAGSQSPVIALAQVLRRRGVRLQRELLTWLREVNENRFLPYGPL